MSLNEIECNSLKVKIIKSIFDIHEISAKESFSDKIHFVDAVCTRVVPENLKLLLIAN